MDVSAETSSSIPGWGANQNFSGHQRTPLSDGNAFAESLQLAVPTTVSCAQVMNAAVAHSLAARDHSVLAHVLETASQRRVA